MTKNEQQTAIAEREGGILDLKNFLASKDYMTIREMQGGEPMPVEIKEACANARAEINRLQEELAELAVAPVDEETSPMDHQPMQEGF